MKSLLFILLSIPAILFAQENENVKYLTGAVPVVNGKVTFSQEVNTPGLSQEQVYRSVFAWCEKRFPGTPTQKGRIFYSDPEKGEIVCGGEEFLTFSNSAFSLDQTVINYQLIILCQPGKCNAKMTAIRYAYNVSDKNTPNRFTAEEQITDEHAVNKNKNKLMRITGKFRIHTINLKDELFAGIQNAFGVIPAAQTPQLATPAVSTPTTAPTPADMVAGIPPVTTAATASLQGFKQITPEQIPGNIMKMLANDWMLITAGNDGKFNMMTASWGGLGCLYNKPVAFCFINPSRYTYQLMEKNDTYTLTFYTETHREALKFCGSNSGKNTDKVKSSGLTPITTPSGSKAFSEAWMVIECRKLVAQSITPEALQNEKLKEEWTGKQLHKMYIGEILNVWVK